MSICGYSGPLERLDAGAMAGRTTPTTRLPAALVEPLFAADGWMQAPSPLIAGALAAAAPNTRRAWSADWGVFRDWCLGPAARYVPERHARVTLPVSPELLAYFVRDQTTGAGTSDGRPRRLTTLRRSLSTLATLHRLLELPDPTKHPLVTNTVKAQARGSGGAGQAAPLRWRRPLCRSCPTRRPVGGIGRCWPWVTTRSRAGPNSWPSMSQTWTGSMHSLRVGAAQDMAALGVETAAILQAGGWKDVRMIKCYLRQLSALEGGMAQWWAAQRSSAPNPGDGR